MHVPASSFLVMAMLHSRPQHSGTRKLNLRRGSKCVARAQSCNQQPLEYHDGNGTTLRVSKGRCEDGVTVTQAQKRDAKKVGRERK